MFVEVYFKDGTMLFVQTKYCYLMRSGVKIHGTRFCLYSDIASVFINKECVYVSEEDV